MYHHYFPIQINTRVLLSSGIIGVLIFGVMLSNYFGEDWAILFGNIIYFPVGGFLILVSVWSLRHFGKDGLHGMAWIAFVGFAFSWGIADNVWTVEELILGMEPYPSFSDAFYLTGYLFLIGFLVLFLMPFRDFVTKKMLAYSVLLSIGIVGTALYLNIDTADLSYGDYVAMLYPIFDGLVLIPTFLGIALFIQDKNRTRLLWILIFLGILISFAGDIVFVSLVGDEQYYTGHPVEILFLSAYVLMAFGVYNYTKDNFMRIR